MPYNKLVVGLTGGIGSGKTTVANLFAAHGIDIIDTDALAKKLTQNDQVAFQAILAKFGTEVIQGDTLNRKAVRKIIFSDNEKKIWLEKLLHPLIRQEMQNLVEKSSSPYCIVVIPLLFESEPNLLINRILVVDATEDKQKERTQLRDQSSHEEVTAIIQSQVTRADRLAGAHDVIHNHGELNDLREQVKLLHKQYLEMAKFIDSD